MQQWQRKREGDVRGEVDVAASIGAAAIELAAVGS
jgi:hypothetical protein